MTREQLGFGTWPLGGRTYGNVDLREARTVLELAYAGNIRLCDTAGDFRLADWLLKGDAREHFERGARETKTPDADKRGYGLTPKRGR